MAHTKELGTNDKPAMKRYHFNAIMFDLTVHKFVVVASDIDSAWATSVTSLISAQLLVSTISIELYEIK